MQVKFLHNLGINDASYCSKAFKCQVNHNECSAGSTVDLHPKAVEYLGKKYPALFEVVESIRGVAPKPAVTAPKMESAK